MHGPFRSRDAENSPPIGCGAVIRARLCQRDLLGGNGIYPITRTKVTERDRIVNSVAAIAEKGRVTASAARREAGLSAVLQRTSGPSCCVVPQRVVLQSRRMLVAVLLANTDTFHLSAKVSYPTHEPSLPSHAYSTPPCSHLGSRWQAGSQAHTHAADA